jgi:hypothetical protein
MLEWSWLTFHDLVKKSSARKWVFNLDGTLSVVVHKKAMLYYVTVFYVQ